MIVCVGNWANYSRGIENYAFAYYAQNDPVPLRSPTLIFLWLFQVITSPLICGTAFLQGAELRKSLYLKLWVKMLRWSEQGNLHVTNFSSLCLAHEFVFICPLAYEQSWVRAKYHKDKITDKARAAWRIEKPLEKWSFLYFRINFHTSLALKFARNKCGWCGQCKCNQYLAFFSIKVQYFWTRCLERELLFHRKSAIGWWHFIKACKKTYASNSILWHLYCLAQRASSRHQWFSWLWGPGVWNTRWGFMPNLKGQACGLSHHGVFCGGSLVR